MKSLTVAIKTTLMGLRFLLAPEDSSTTLSGGVPLGDVTFWNRVKTILWLVFSVLVALQVGQL